MNHTHYLGIIEMTYSAKNKLQKEVLEYFHSINRVLIEKSSVEKLKESIINKMEELNSSNPRCKPMKIYFEKGYEEKTDIIIRDTHVVHYVIRACETKNIF